MSEEITPNGAGPSGQPAEQSIVTAQALANMNLADTAKQRESQLQKETYDFWETQPVMQFKEESSTAQEDGPIDSKKTVADVRKEPLNLPNGFEWSECDMENETVRKEVFTLLELNYVEDDDNMFRFLYSREFLKWALQPPGFRREWHLGVRTGFSSAHPTGRLVAFITAVPGRVKARAAVVPMVEINFLCVHKKLRHKRLAPVLIREITRRVNLRGIWQAAYTAGVVLPKPVAECQYWHRSLNPKKLIEVGFSRLAQRMTMMRTIKLYKLPDRPVTPGLRPLRASDVPQVTALLNAYLGDFQLAPVFDEADVEHYLMPVTDVVDSHVVEDPNAPGVITDLLSYYTLPSTIIGNEKHNTLKAAFMFYTVAKVTPLQQLMTDALILAKSRDHDVFNALDIFQNASFLKDLKFGIGDGRLRYYLYNWRISQQLTAEEVGLVLL